MGKKEIAKPAVISIDWWRCVCGDSFDISNKHEICPTCKRKIDWDSKEQNYLWRKL